MCVACGGSLYCRIRRFLIAIVGIRVRIYFSTRSGSISKIEAHTFHPCHHGTGGYAMIQILGSAGLETNCERCLGGRHFFSGFDTPATRYHHYPEGAEPLKCHGLRRLQMPGQDGNQVIDGVLYISPGKGLVFSNLFGYGRCTDITCTDHSWVE